MPMEKYITACQIFRIFFFESQPFLLRFQLYFLKGTERITLMWVNVCRLHQILLMFYNVRQTCTPDKISAAFSRRKTHLYTDIPVLKKHKANLMASVDMCYFTTSQIKWNSLKRSCKELL